MAKTEKQLAEEIIAIAKAVQPKFKIANNRLIDENGQISLALYPVTVIYQNTVYRK